MEPYIAEQLGVDENVYAILVLCANSTPSLHRRRVSKVAIAENFGVD